jgi:hypothetical protein
MWGPLPPAPTGLVATPISHHQINLAWSHNSWNEDGFHLENSEDNRHWKKIAALGPTVRTYSNIKLAGNKLYYYRVRAFNKIGSSDYSNVASARTFK